MIVGKNLQKEPKIFPWSKGVVFNGMGIGDDVSLAVATTGDRARINNHYTESCQRPGENHVVSSDSEVRSVEI